MQHSLAHQLLSSRAVSTFEFEALGDLRMIRNSKITKGATVRARAARGFTLLELVVVVAIAMILAGIAVPIINNSMRVYSFRSSIAAFTGIIQSTRYNAIYHGCPYQLTFTAAPMTYTVASQVPAVGTTTCLAAMGVASAAVPLPGKGAALNTNLTLLFHPSGLVQATTGSLTTTTMTFPGIAQAENIQVSAFGRVYVTP
jgi:prepilin-type N-terminal cleavage/methylation domain-containing protein